MAGEVTATAAAAAAGDCSDVLARVLGKLGAATSAAGVCVASAAVAAAAVLAAGDLEEGKFPTFLVVTTCVAFHAGLWLLIHAVGGGGGGGAESE